MEPNQNIQVGNNIGDNAVSVQEPKKAANVPTMVFGLIAMVFAGLAVFFGLDYFKTEEKGNTQKDETTVVVVKSDMAEDYNEVNTMMQNLVSSIDDVHGIIENNSGLTYKPKDLNTYIPMKLDLEMTILSSIESPIDDNAIAKLIDDKLKKNGFESVGVLPFTGSAGPKINGYLNSDSEIICGTYENVLKCAKTSWSWLTEEEEALAKELETAYYDKIGEYPVTLFDLNNEIEDSQYAPYQTIWVGLGGGAGLFYRVSPDTEWQFFRVTQAILECSEYNTDDLKKAYLGEPCLLDMTESTVQL